jgi:hypothetical protein
MFYRLDNLSILIGVLLTGTMAYQLVTGIGVLSFGEPGEFFSFDGTGEAIFLSQLTVCASWNELTGYKSTYEAGMVNRLRAIDCNRVLSARSTKSPPERRRRLRALADASGSPLERFNDLKQLGPPACASRLPHSNLGRRNNSSFLVCHC